MAAAPEVKLYVPHDAVLIRAARACAKYQLNDDDIVTYLPQWREFARRVIEEAERIRAAAIAARES